MPTSTPDSPGLDDLVTRARQLYTLPAVAMRVLELTSGTDTDAGALKTCLAQDPALTARLLRVVNSSVFGFPGQISDLGRAIALLGSRPLRLLVLGFSLPRRLLEGIDAQGLARYWRRALVRAVAAREICRARGDEGADEAFVAGLMHDLGELVFWKEFGPAYARLVVQADALGEPRARWEQATFGCDAAQLSAALLRHWGLPAALAAAIAPSEVEGSAPPCWAGALHLAGELAWMVDGEKSPAAMKFERPPGWSDAALCDLLEQVQRQVEQLAGGLQVVLPRGGDYRDILAAAQARMAELHEESLVDASSSLAVEEQVAREGGALTVAHKSHERPAARTQTTAAPAARANHLTTDDPGVLGQIATSLAACRAAREPLSLMLVEIRAASDLVFRLGAPRAAQAEQFVDMALSLLTDRPACAIRLDEARFALLMAGCDRTAACAAGRQLLRALERWSGEQFAENSWPLALGLGVATVALPPPHLPPLSLLKAAERCLFAATRGGGGIKSIEV